MILNFKIENQELTRLNELPKDKPVSGSKNYLKTKFEFNTPEWEGLLKFALFKNEQGEEFTKYLGRGMYGECFVPLDVLREDYFAISVYGGDLINTNEIIVTLIRGGYDRCNVGIQDAYVDMYEELDTKLSKEEMEEAYFLVSEKVDKDCFDGFFDNRMIVWMQNLIDGINEL